MSRDRKIVLGAVVGGGAGVVFLGVAALCFNVSAWFLMPVSVPVVLLLAQVTTNFWVVACGTVGYFAGVGAIVGWLQQSELRYKRHLTLVILVVLLIAHAVVYQLSLSNIHEVIAKALVDALIRGATTTPP